MMIDGPTVFAWFAGFWLPIATPFLAWYAFFRKYRRPKPAGYVGRFRMPSGEIVHVARMPDRTLMVISEEKPGVFPRDLGAVSGPELVRWEKLGSTPDGNECVARPN